MSVTLQTFINDVENKVNAEADTTLFELMAGTNSTAATIDTNGTIISLLNDGADDLCRTALPIWGKVVYPNLPIGTQTVFTADTNFAGSGVLWGPQNVIWGTTPLRSTSRERLALSYPSYETAANGTPVYWWDSGQVEIAIYPRPSSLANLTVSGLITPAHIAIDADLDTDIALIPDQYVYILVAYVCWKLALKRVDDGSMAERLQGWQQEYIDQRNELLATYWSINPSLMRGFYRQPMVNK